MKKFLLTLTAIFICTIAYAHTINWYVGDTILETTTCDSGDSITPPTAPYKYGYHFVEWAPYSARIEYLESTGTQYIDTGVYPNQNTRAIISLQTGTNASTDVGRPFGVRDDQGLNFSMLIFPGYETNRIRFDYYTSRDIIINTSVSTLSKKLLIDFNNSQHQVKVYNENNLIANTSFPTATWQSNESLYMGLNDGEDKVAMPNNTKIYQFQIYDNDTLVRDFIPVLDPDGVPCMYDKVEQKLYYNQGTGQFIAGPVIGE